MNKNLKKNSVGHKAGSKAPFQAVESNNCSNYFPVDTLSSFTNHLHDQGLACWVTMGSGVGRCLHHAILLGTSPSLGTTGTALHIWGPFSYICLAAWAAS